MVAQLRADGFGEVASALSARVLEGEAVGPSGRLLHIFGLGTQADARRAAIDRVKAQGGGPQCLDLEADDPAVPRPPLPALRTAYASLQHTAAIRAIAFGRDGALAAAGDGSGAVRVYAAARIVAEGAGCPGAVVCALNAHNKDTAVHEVAFHPEGRLLFSAGADKTVRSFDITAVSSHARRAIQESHAVNALALHPGGRFAVVGTDHPVVRLYDLEAGSCYASQNPLEHHRAPIAAAAYSPDGRQYATGCREGYVKLWDGGNARCIRTLEDAHNGEAVTSVQFSKNGKYLLTAGRDSCVRLWDTREGKLIETYGGGSQRQPGLRACFGDRERFVYAANDSSTAPGVTVWETTRRATATVRGMGVALGLAHSPTAEVLATGGGDRHFRLWTTAKTAHKAPEPEAEHAPQDAVAACKAFLESTAAVAQ